MKAAPARMSQEEVVHYAKFVVALVIGFSAWAIAAPVISFYCPEFWDAIPYFSVVALMYFQAVGALALLNISNRPRFSRDILFGAVSAALILAVAPFSIRVALIKIPISARWIVCSALGSLAVATYLYLALRFWRRGGLSPNKSLERTRER